MAKRQSLGKGLNALMPNVPRETAAKSGGSARPAAKKAPGSAPARKAPPTKAPAAKKAAPTKRSGVPAAVAATAPGAAMQVAGLTLLDIPVSKISANPNQPRKIFDDEALQELVFSIKEVGLLQPIVVRPHGNGYELIAGERRLRATKKAGKKSIPALVRETKDDDMLRDALLENLHRSQLTALEEASAYQQLLHDFGCTQEQLASRLGRSRPQITNTIRLLNLPPSVQRRVAAGVLSAGHARALLGLKDHAAMEKLAARIVAEGLSVRTVEEIVSVGVAETKTSKGAPAAKAKGKLSAPGLADLNNRLSERLDTRVTIQLGRSKGKVSIEFATLADLRRIVEVIDPPKRDMFGAPTKK
jgi:ParB family chromosome partitioning protein